MITDSLFESCNHFFIYLSTQAFVYFAIAEMKSVHIFGKMAESM